MKIEKQQTWDYSFRCNDYTDYTMKLTFKADNKLFDYLLKESSRKLKRKHNLNVNGNLDIIDRFELEDRYKPLINNFIKKPLNITEKKELNPDGMYLVSNKVDKTIYIKNNDTWTIEVYIKGQYIKK
jgi:hypothetical protein